MGWRRRVASGAFDSPDLIVLGLESPHWTGFPSSPGFGEAQCPSRTLILTARGQVEDRVKGLKAGADDYGLKSKPFSSGRIDGADRSSWGGAGSHPPRPIF